MKTAYVQSYTYSKIFEAPLDFVYAWCTDFQEDDLKMIGSKNRRHIIERNARRVVWVVEKAGKTHGETDPIRVVWLRPPDAWHLEECGDGTEVGDYKLTALGKTRTRLDMKFAVTYGSKGEVEDKESLVAEAEDHWHKYGSHLEKDYARSK